MTKTFLGKVTLKVYVVKYHLGYNALKQIKKFVDKKTLISLYNALIQPYFSYCCEVLDVFGETQSKRLQKLQNRAARVIASIYRTMLINKLYWIYYRMGNIKRTTIKN